MRDGEFPYRYVLHVVFMQPYPAESLLYFPTSSVAAHADTVIPSRGLWPIAEARACRVTCSTLILYWGRPWRRQRWIRDPLPYSGPSHSKSGIRVRWGAAPGACPWISTRHRGAHQATGRADLRRPTSALQTSRRRTTQLSIRALRHHHRTKPTRQSPPPAA